MWWRDFLYTLRTLRRNRSFCFGIVACLVLGIAPVSANFTVLNAALLKPLPFAEPSRLVMLYDVHAPPSGTPQEYRVSPLNFSNWREQNEVFEELAAMLEVDVNLTGDGEPVLAKGALVTANWLAVLGIQPMAGRSFSADEDRVGAAAPVAVISHGFWQRQFGGDLSVVGRSVVLDDEKVTVVGIMPPDFGFPHGLEGLEPRDLWRPMGLDPNLLPDREWHSHFVVGRLDPGVSLDQAQAHMEAIGERMVDLYPETNTGWLVRVKPLQKALVGSEVASALSFLLTGSFFLLLIACINVASMLLVRANVRGREVALRVALGADHRHVLRLLLTESVSLALMGGAVGLLLAYLSVSPLLALSGLVGPTYRDVTVDLPVLAFTLAITAVTGVVFGLAPVLKLFQTDLRKALLEGSARSGRGRLGRLFQGALVVGQIALVFALLVGAGLAIKSFRQLLRVEPGFDTANLLTVRTPFSPTLYPGQGDRVAVAERMRTQVGALPGVESATVAFVLPIGDLEIGARFAVEGYEAKPNEVLITNNRMIGPDFFETMKLPVVEGRGLTSTDFDSDTAVNVVVSRQMAKTYWPDRNALGRRVKGGAPDAPWMTVVGIAEDVRDTSLKAPVGSTWYVPYSRMYETPWVRFVVRTAGDPMALVPSVREAIWSVDPNQTVTDVTTVAEMVSGSMREERFSTVLLGLFAAIGLLLAAIGVYGLMSYSVSERRSEMGIRMAFGAETGTILRMILRDAAKLTAMGIAAGLALSFVVSRLFASLLFEVEPTDPLVGVAIVVFLTAVTLLATYVPARRATKVDPAEVLNSL